jgi:alpha-beta hydrolase superfamily lysophospholipase
MDQMNADRKKRHIRNMGITAFVGVILGLVVIGVVLGRKQLDALLAPSISLPQEMPADYALPYEDVQLVAEDGVRLTAWFVPPDHATSAAVVIAHGLGGNRGSHLPEAAILHDHDYAVLLLDLRAHGESGGEFKSYGYYEALDVLAAVDYLVADQGIPAERVAMMGTSLGGAAVVRAASLRQSPHVLIVLSTYQSLDAAVDDAFDDIALLPSWPFAPIMVRAAERRLGLESESMDLVMMLASMPPRPTLLIHGAADELLPLYHHQALCQAATWASCWVVPGMGHESPARFDPDAYEARLIDFLDEALLGK